MNQPIYKLQSGFFTVIVSDFTLITLELQYKQIFVQYIHYHPLIFGVI